MILNYDHLNDFEVMKSRKDLAIYLLKASCTNLVFCTIEPDNCCQMSVKRNIILHTLPFCTVLTVHKGIGVTSVSIDILLDPYFH